MTVARNPHGRPRQHAQPADDARAIRMAMIVTSWPARFTEPLSAPRQALAPARRRDRPSATAHQSQALADKEIAALSRRVPDRGQHLAGCRGMRHEMLRGRPLSSGWRFAPLRPCDLYSNVPGLRGGQLVWWRREERRSVCKFLLNDDFVIVRFATSPSKGRAGSRYSMSAIFLTGGRA